MKCIIVGVGKVGYSLVANLCEEGHEVTVIDSSRRRLDIMEEHFNINIVEGNAAKLTTLREADIEHADLLIAVTEKDELNMVASFVAKNSGAASTIARVRNPGYSDFDDKSRMDASGVRSSCDASDTKRRRSSSVLSRRRVMSLNSCASSVTSSRPRGVRE